MHKFVSTTLLFICAALVTPISAASAGAVVAKFGGECQGSSFHPSPRLARLIQNTKLRQTSPCDSPVCDGVFAYDLDGDGRNEYFVRLSCGATGNCTWGIFSERPVRLRGVFIAWFFYIHRRHGSWNALTAYTRVGGNQGVIATLANRRGTYVQTSRLTEHGDHGDPQPFLTRMGVPKCS